MLRRCRYWTRRTQFDSLEWTRVGAVWAVDFTEAPHFIDGVYPYLLVVRELGAGFQLMALPTRDQTAQTVRHAMLSLFAAYGRPLLLKSDNGSAFKAGESRDFLAEHGVLLLPSPPRTPTYNGACEAGIGSIKTRCHEIASARGCPDPWTADDVEAARLQANASRRLPGEENSTPDEAHKIGRAHV